MSEENTALDQMVEAMTQIIGTAEDEGKAIREEAAIEAEQAKIERIAQELRMVASGYLIEPTETE